MDHPLIEGFRAHAVWWMAALFVGVLFWAFRDRWRARRRHDSHLDDQDD